MIKKRQLLSVILFILLVFLPFAYAETTSETNLIDSSYTTKENFVTGSGHEVAVLVSGSMPTYDDFNAYAINKKQSICTCDDFSYTIHVINTGTVNTNYNLKKSGDASKYVTFVPSLFVLAPGESIDVEVFGSVSCDSSLIGEYALDTYFETSSGLKKVLHQNLNIKKCEAFTFYPIYPSYNNLPCTPTIYELKIGNNKNFPDTYKLGISNLDSEFYSFSEAYVLLTPNEEKSVFLFLNLACDESGSYSYDVSATSVQTSQFKSFPVYLTVNKDGYNFKLESGVSKEINEDISEEDKLSFQLGDGHYSFCEESNYYLPVRLTNLAHFSNTFTIKSNDDAIETIESVTLDPNQAIILNSIFEGEDAKLGDHTYQLTVTSDKGKLNADIKFKASLLDCDGKSNSNKFLKGLLFFLLFFLLLILLIALLFLFLRPKKSLYDELDEEERLKQQKEQELKDAEAATKAEQEKVEQERLKKERLEKEKIRGEELAAAKEAEKLAKKERKKQEKIAKLQKKAEKKAANKSKDSTSSASRWWTIPFILGILFLILILFFFIKGCVVDPTDSGLNETDTTLIESVDIMTNENIVTSEESAVDESIVDEPVPEPVIEEQTEEPELLSTQEIQSVVYINPRENMTQDEISFLYQYIYEDETKSVDLSNYFVDVDGDELSYGNSHTPNVDIDYDGDIASIIPHLGWSGETSVVFKAIDGKGGYAESPEIAIVVKQQGPVLKFIRKNMWWLIGIAILLLILLILLISYVVYKAKHPKQILLRKKAKGKKMKK
jgi:hypothetical protein